MTGVSVDLFGVTIARQWIPIGRATPRGGLPAHPGILLERVERIVVGDTGMKGLRARDAARDIGQAFGHFLTDDLDIIECVPAVTSAVGRVEQARFLQPRRGPQAEGDPQASSIFVNLCFGGPIDPTRAYERWVGLAASLCFLFAPSPAPRKLILARVGGPASADGLDPSRNDPDLALRSSGQDYTAFRKAVEDALQVLEQKAAIDLTDPCHRGHAAA